MNSVSFQTQRSALKEFCDRCSLFRSLPVRLSLIRITAILLLLSCYAPFAGAETKPPNIIIILADDLGYGDLGCYGHPSIDTPNLDRLAAEGLRFTDFYAGCCYCTPSRAAFLTGRLPIRSGMSGTPGRHVLYPKDTGGLPVDEVTIASALKSKGYATACIGKWHLGDKAPHRPTEHGFDYFFGILNCNDSYPTESKYRDVDSLSRTPDWHHFNVPLLRGTKVIERPADQSTFTKRFTEESIQFMTQHKDQPFFLYLAHTAPHVPVFASEKFQGKSLRGIYGDAVQELDWSVGQVLDWLRKEKLEENTFVFFASDNGPWLLRQWNGGSASLLRDGKGGTWEGGYRVPAIARWPGKIPAAATTHEIADGMDLFTTCLKLAGAEMPKVPVDGVDLSPLLFKGQSVRDTQLYYYANLLSAVRKGKWKAHFLTHDGFSDTITRPHPPLLFDLGEDPGEKFNLADEHPDVVAELTKIYDEARESIVAGKLQY